MKKTLAIVLIAMGLVAAVSAQESVTEMKYFSIESSVVMGYSIPDEKVVGGSSFLLDFAVADNFALGVQTMMFNTSTVAAMKLGFYMNESLGFAATFGTSGTIGYFGVGAFMNLLKNASDTGLSNAIKLRLEYLFPETGIGDGLIALTAGFGLGL